MLKRYFDAGIKKYVHWSKWQPTVKALGLYKAYEMYIE
jgi:hypothetical protein